MSALAGVVFGGASIESPELGMVASVNGAVCVYSNIDGVIGWYPIAKAMDTKTYRHIQAVPAAEWTVNHNLGTKEFFAVITDEHDNSIVSYASMEFDPVNPLNKFKVFFAEPISGSMFIVASTSFSTPELNTSKITLGDLVISTGGISWQGNYINMATFTAVDDSINTLTSAVSALSSDNNTIRGLISAETQRATAAEAALRQSITDVSTTTVNNEVTRAQAAEADLLSKINGEIARATGSETTIDGRVTAANSAITLLRLDMNTADALKVDIADWWATKAVYDIIAGDAGNVVSGQVIFDLPAVRKLKLPANLAGMRAVADVAPAAAIDFYVQVNSTTKFTISFAAGATVGTVANAPEVTVAVGDRLRIITSKADTAIKNIAIAIPALMAQ